MWGGPAGLLLWRADLCLPRSHQFGERTADENARIAEQNAEEARKNERKARENEEKAKEFSASAGQAYATLIGEVQQKMNRQPALQDLKKQILLVASKGLQSLIARMDDNKDAFNLRNLADAHRQMGDLFRELGEINQAYEQFQETHKIMGEHRPGQSKRGKPRSQLVKSWLALGDMRFMRTATPHAHARTTKRGSQLPMILSNIPRATNRPDGRQKLVAYVYYKLGDIADVPSKLAEYTRKPSHAVRN